MVEFAAFKTMSSSLLLPFSLPQVSRDTKVRVRDTSYTNLPLMQRKVSVITSSLPETAASVGIAMAVVGAAAVFLRQRSKNSVETEVPLKVCEDCNGTGICSECKGEGFTLKRKSEESAEKARLTAKNAATRYTAGLICFTITMFYSLLFFPLLVWLDSETGSCLSMVSIGFRRNGATAQSAQLLDPVEPVVAGES
ncbi:hypothetical protein AKJ16_DCAP07355 [Drosera capensis]